MNLMGIMNLHKNRRISEVAKTCAELFAFYKLPIKVNFL